MNISKAIEIVANFSFTSNFIPSNDVNDAVKLLIEAGKCILEARVKYHSVWGDLLPGETEE